MERKTGTVYSVNPKGWFFLYVTPTERYFLHITELKLDRMPLAGELIEFTPAPPRKPGQLPCATNATVIGVA